MSSTAWLNLRYTVPERAKAFRSGLKRLGFRVEHGIPGEFGEHDIFITWNRIGGGHVTAKRFEKRGQAVLVAENAAWGNDFAGQRWYTLARRRHNTQGMFPVGDPVRWDSLNYPLLEWRTGGDTVILPQRGIGAEPTKMPGGWQIKALKKHGGRIRKHPGTRACTPLEHDLRKCGRVITWGSGAAIKALTWAQWTLDEIASGEPFERLL